MKRPVVAIVDDDPAIRIALTRLIRSLGYEAAPFDSAACLLEALDETSLDCVVTDLQMPGLNGFELLQALKEQQPQLPVVIITAYPSESNRERFFSSGAFAYLPKPFDPGEFERCLVAAFRGS